MLQDSVLKTVEKNIRLFVPQLFLVGLLILDLLSFPSLSIGGARPYFVLMGLYYWAIYRPTLTPVPYCFVLGLLVDIVTGMPLGLHAFFYSVISWIVSEQRRFLMAQPYVVKWALFGLVCCLNSLGQWAMMSLVTWHMASITPELINIILNVFLFPLVSLPLVVTHRFLPINSVPYS